MKNQTKLTDKQRKSCKHKIIVINSMIMRAYCKRCYLDLDNTIPKFKYHDFVTKKIKEGKWEKSWNGNVELWSEDGN